MAGMPNAMFSIAVFTVLCSCTASKVDKAVGRTPAAPDDRTSPVDLKGTWPCFRGPTANGFSSMTGFNKNWAAKQPKLLWQAPLTDNGWSGPACDGKTVYIVDHNGPDDIVHAWDLVSGHVKWEYRYADANADNQGFTRTTPAIDAGNLYIVSKLGKVFCLDIETGKPKWRHDLVADYGGQKPTWDFAASPVIDGSKLILAPGAQDGAIVVLNKTTGAFIRKAGNGPACYATPVLATIRGKRQYVLFQAKKIAGISIETGQELWSVPWQTGPDVNAAAPVVIGNSVFIASGYGHGCGLIDVGNDGAQIRWQSRLMQAQFNAPVLFNGYIYGTGDPGNLICLDPNTGNAQWVQPGFEKGGLCAADGVVFVMNGSNGDVVLVKLDPTGYRELGRTVPVQGRCWDAPILAEGKLIIRTIDKIAVLDIS